MTEEPFINPEWMAEFKKMEQLYPEFMKRINKRGEWMTIMFFNAYEFIEKSGLKNEFIDSLTDKKKKVLQIIFEVKQYTNKENKS